MKILRHILHFLIGALLLCFFSIVQKLIAGYPLQINGFIVPFIFGGIGGLITGYLFLRLKQQNHQLMQANEEFSATNEELKDSFNELRNVYNELQVTKHKATESDRLKSSFLSNLSHEIRTPLNGIVGFAQMMDDDDLAAEDRKMYIENLSESSDRLLEIVNNIVEIAKIESGSVELHREKVNLSDILNEIFEEFQKMAEERQLDFNLTDKIPYPRSYIYCDVQKLRAILKHLVHNALKFTKEGEVTFGAQINQSFIEFFVEDTGIGMSKKTQELIFNPFSQGETLLTNDITGTGLGLTIAKSYVELMGGMLELKSEEGKGSRFSFVIPYDRASS
jgi:signal transduction histidine kinase